jgi:hypothetical protein
MAIPRTALTALLATVSVSGCAHHYVGVYEPYGFFSGFWHGLIFEFSLIGYLFFDSVYIIGKPNTGFFYYVGFALGLFKVGFVGR